MATSVAVCWVLGLAALVSAQQPSANTPPDGIGMAAPSESPAPPQAPLVADAAADAAPTATAPRVVDERFASLRDPFWPVGYSPAAIEKPVVEEAAPAQVQEQAQEEAPAFDEMVKQLAVRGIMTQGGEYVAIVNDQVVRRGDLVSLVSGSHKYRWKVRSIGERGVRFEPYDVSNAGSGGDDPATRAKMERVIKN